MGFKCGIVGLPNVGKSTLFNALTAARALAANYPFATIDPNVGVAAVPDVRLDRIAEIVQPRSVVPTAMEFVDIAGLVAGASQGEGLGNKFLAHIRETQAVAHVVRCFDDGEVAHVSGQIDPVSDIATVNTELALADLGTLERALDRHTRRARAGEKDSQAAVAALERIRSHLKRGDPVRSMVPPPAVLPAVHELHLLTAKPTMYVANVEDPGAGSDRVDTVREVAATEGAVVVVISAKLEAEIAELDGADRLEFLAEMGETESGLDRVIRIGHDLLGLGTFFTGNEKEARAWTFRRGMTAPQAAGVVHTDFQRGFIRAEVVGYEDFVAAGGEAGAKEAGKWRLEGRDYIVQEADVIRFRFNL
ncbi:MAG: redox-regulated ATPase YchF [Acidimicrobiia bacterium]|nr:redox-regulated ATPase YchF [Acidimicrobiia bacterium]